MDDKMSIDKLIGEYYKHNPDGHYFDDETLKFFGESRSTMKVLKQTEKVTDFLGEVHTCYVLSKLSKKYPGGPKRTYAYFDIETFDVITPKINY